MQLPQYPRYESYKPSGVDWLGDVPGDWQVTPGRACLYEKKDKNTGMKESTVLSLSYGKVIVKPEEKLTGLVPESFETYQIVEPGDIIIRGTDLQNDVTSLRTGLAKDRGIITSAYINLRPHDNVLPFYLHYVLHSYDVKKVFYGLGSGLRQNLSYEDFKYLDLPIPDIATQERIVSFLDDKTDKIDRAVKIKEGQIALLRERKQIIIQEAVTKGLNPDAPMKESGIDWIGQIPAHWDVENPKWLFRHRKEKARKGEQQLAATQKYGVIPQQEYMEMEGRRIVQVVLDFDILKHVEAGDFVMSMRSFQGGIEYSDFTGCVSSAYVAMEPGELIHVPYYKYLLKSPRFIEALQVTSNLVRDGQALRFDNFAMVTLPVAPLDEQRQIANYIDEALSKSDKAIELKERQIEALTEYKATLINAAVTGKIKVI